MAWDMLEVHGVRMDMQLKGGMTSGELWDQ